METGSNREPTPWEPSRCRVPMWWGYGAPAGLCGETAFGHQLPRALLAETRGHSDWPYCNGHCCPMHGGPQEGEPIVFQDGLTENGHRMWCAVMPGFTNIQECAAGFSGDPAIAIKRLHAEMQATEKKPEGQRQPQPR